MYAVVAESKAKVKEFLKAIREKFVSTVNPLESGLEDGLIQCCVLTNTDTESLEGGHLPTRAEKARSAFVTLPGLACECFLIFFFIGYLSSFVMRNKLSLGHLFWYSVLAPLKLDIRPGLDFFFHFSIFF